MNTTDFYFVPATYPQTILTVQITASITSILSLFGASLIILTYVAFKDLRTIARQLLVNLSVADIVLCSSHFVGVLTNNKRFLPHYNQETWNTSSTDPLCITQGAFTVYATLASFLWSMLIAIYLLTLTITKRPIVVKILVPLLYSISWGIPAIILIFLAVKGYFGFEPIAATGWCYTARKNSTASLTGDFLSYEVWVYISFGALTVLYLLLFICIRSNKMRIGGDSVRKYSLKGDFKLLCVPLIFVILRVWSTVLDVSLHYIHKKEQMKFQQSVAAAVITVLSAIGVNAQGLANAILFCMFTKEVRKRLAKSLFRHYGNSCLCHWIKCGCRKKSHGRENLLDHEGLVDESSSIQLESSMPLSFRNDYGT